MLTQKKLGFDLIGSPSLGIWTLIIIIIIFENLVREFWDYKEEKIHILVFSLFLTSK